jgi:hypothetical protein
MAKYKGAYRSDLEEDQTSYSEDLQAQEEEAPTTSEEPGTDDEGFKKRYGDLRRHMQQKDSSHQGELDSLKTQLDAATKKQIKFPKSADEIKKWAEQYPDVAQIVETIAGMKANEALESGREELDSIRKDTKAQKEQRAYQELLSLHPDFPDIREQEDFHAWVEVQPSYIREALYSNSSDAHAASRAIDLYKSDSGTARKGKAKTDTSADAAKEVGRSSSTTPSGQEKSKFSESQVKNMSDAEYDKHETAILESMQKGSFSYDITGAAR